MLIIGGDWVLLVRGTFFNFSSYLQLNYFSPPRREKANHLAEDFHRFSELEQDGIERVAIVSFKNQIMWLDFKIRNWIMLLLCASDIGLL